LISFEPKRLREALAPAVDDLDAIPLDIGFYDPAGKNRDSSAR
jgi:hypothetical protein